MHRPRIALAALAALLIPFFCSSVSAQPPAQQAVTGSHTVAFNSPRVDVLDGGKIVVNVESSGEFKGLLTLNLAPNESGTLAGEWVLSVRYTDNTDPATGIEPPAAHEHETADQHEAGAAVEDSDHPHRDYVRYVDKGTVGGSVESATVSIGADGSLADFSAVLHIDLGTLTFAGVTGTGTADLARGLTLIF